MGLLNGGVTLKLVMSGVIGNTRPPWYKRISFKRKRYRHGRCIYLELFDTLVSFEEFAIVYNYAIKYKRSWSPKQRWKTFQIFFKVNTMIAEYCSGNLPTYRDYYAHTPIIECRSHMNDLINRWDVYEEKVGTTINSRDYWNCVLESLQ